MEWGLMVPNKQWNVLSTDFWAKSKGKFLEVRKGNHRKSSRLARRSEISS